MKKITNMWKEMSDDFEKMSREVTPRPKCLFVDEVGGGKKDGALSPESCFQPPSYEHATKIGAENEEAPVAADEQTLPSYETATNLPSYDMSQKIQAHEIREELMNLYFHLDSPNQFDPPKDISEIDCMFWTSFWLALLFNWIGFFIGYCILGSVPSRCGALSGLGLSIFNCLLYLRASGTCYDHYRMIVWWVMLIVSVLVFLKGIFAGIKIRSKHRDHGRVGLEDIY